MKYAYADLGPQEQGKEVTVNVRGGVSSVMLMDVGNFLRYSSGRSFRFTGGRYRGSPTKLEIPEDEHWYLVLDLATYNGRAKATVEVLDPRAPDPERDAECTLIEA